MFIFAINCYTRKQEILDLYYRSYWRTKPEYIKNVIRYLLKHKSKLHAVDRKMFYWKIKELSIKV